MSDKRLKIEVTAASIIDRTAAAEIIRKALGKKGFHCEILTKTSYVLAPTPPAPPQPSPFVPYPGYPNSPPHVPPPYIPDMVSMASIESLRELWEEVFIKMEAIFKSKR